MNNGNVHFIEVTLHCFKEIMKLLDMPFFSKIMLMVVRTVGFFHILEVSVQKESVCHKFIDSYYKNIHSSGDLNTITS